MTCMCIHYSIFTTQYQSFWQPNEMRTTATYLRASFCTQFANIKEMVEDWYSISSTSETRWDHLLEAYYGGYKLGLVSSPCFRCNSQMCILLNIHMCKTHGVHGEGASDSLSYCFPNVTQSRENYLRKPTCSEKYMWVSPQQVAKPQ